jgi:hypothetical protein
MAETFDQIEDLLDREHLAIMAADFDRLSRLAPEKERLFMGLSGLPSPDVATLDRMRRIAERNQQLLASAREGIRSVTQRLAAIRSVEKTLNTYDRSGKMSSFSTSKGGFEHKA